MLEDREQLKDEMNEKGQDGAKSNTPEEPSGSPETEKKEESKSDTSNKSDQPTNSADGDQAKGRI